MQPALALARLPTPTDCITESQRTAALQLSPLSSPPELPLPSMGPSIGSSPVRSLCIAAASLRAPRRGRRHHHGSADVSDDFALWHANIGAQRPHARACPPLLPRATYHVFLIPGASINSRSVPSSSSSTRMRTRPPRASASRSCSLLAPAKGGRTCSLSAQTS